MSNLLANQGAGPPAWEITGAGNITSGEAFGQPMLSVVIATTGIVTAEAFGTPSVSVSITAISIPTAEAFGNPAVSAAIIAAGNIASQEVFGLPTIYTGILSGNLVCLSNGDVAIKIAGKTHLLLSASIRCPNESIKGKAVTKVGGELVRIG